MKMFHPLPEAMSGSYPTFTLVDWDSDGIPDIQYSTKQTYVLYGAIDDAGNWHPRDGQWQMQMPVGESSFGFKPHRILCLWTSMTVGWTNWLWQALRAERPRE